MKLSDHDPLLTDPWSFELNTLDEWEHGSARIQVELTTTLPQSMPEQTLWRLASHVMLNRLTEDALKQAFESLADIYVWQKERSQVVFAEREPVVVQRSPAIRYEERQPFDAPE